MNDVSLGKWSAAKYPDCKTWTVFCPIGTIASRLSEPNAKYIEAMVSALVAWRSAEKKHAAMVLGLKPCTEEEKANAQESSDRALHKVRALADWTTQ